MDSSSVALLDVIRALAFVGDLAMGQPTDHSPRAAWIAGQLARAGGADDEACTRATTCTAATPATRPWPTPSISGCSSRG